MIPDTRGLAEITRTQRAQRAYAFYRRLPQTTRKQVISDTCAECGRTCQMLPTTCDGGAMHGELVKRLEALERGTPL